MGLLVFATYYPTIPRLATVIRAANRIAGRSRHRDAFEALSVILILTFPALLRRPRAGPATAGTQARVIDGFTV